MVVSVAGGYLKLPSSFLRLQISLSASLMKSHLAQIHVIQICGLWGERRWKEMWTVYSAELKDESRVL